MALHYKAANDEYNGLRDYITLVNEGKLTHFDYIPERVHPIMSAYMSEWEESPVETDPETEKLLARLFVRTEFMPRNPLKESFVRYPEDFYNVMKSIEEEEILDFSSFLENRPISDYLTDKILGFAGFVYEWIYRNGGTARTFKFLARYYGTMENFYNVLVQYPPPENGSLQ